MFPISTFIRRLPPAALLLLVAVGGCAGDAAGYEEHDGLPPTRSAAVARGTGRELSWAAIDKGRVWLCDAKSGTILFRDDVARGDIIRVDPFTRRVSVNGQPRPAGEMSSDQALEIRFLTSTDRRDTRDRWHRDWDADRGR